MPKDPLTATVALARARGPRAGDTRVVAVDGRSGSGKTEWAQALARRVRDDGARVALVRLDDIYRGWDALAETPELVVATLLEPLAQRRPGGYRGWDWEHDRPTSWTDVAPTDWLVLEGVGSGAAVCRPYLSALVWVEAPDDIRFERAMGRDGATYRPHWSRWARQEHAYLAADLPQAHADVVVTTH